MFIIRVLDCIQLDMMVGEKYLNCEGRSEISVAIYCMFEIHGKTLNFIFIVKIGKLTAFLMDI